MKLPASRAGSARSSIAYELVGNLGSYLVTLLVLSFIVEKRVQG